MKLTLHLTLIFVCILLGASFVLHFWRINIPDTPAFDEVHFATYAAGYAKGTSFFDIHPPLGKFIYAIPLFFTNANNLKDSNYLEKEGKIDDVALPLRTTHFFKPFGSFPYITLRATSAFFGILLAFSVFFFLRSLTQNNAIALLGMFFAVFESTLLIETRLILLNGMFLAFGFLALGFLYKQKPNFVLTGILLGLSLSIKLIGVVFLGPVLFFFFSKHFTSSKTSLIRVGIVAFFVVFFSWILISNVLLPAGDRVALYTSFLNVPHLVTDVSYFFESHLPQFGSAIKAFFLELYITLSGYTEGTSHVVQSPWYLWPFMMLPFNYSSKMSINIVLLGNPFIWAIGTLSIIFSLCILALKRFRARITEDVVKSVLVIGYFSSLLPFALLHRSTFLYHYFPALLFSICLASIYIYEHLETLTTKRKKMALTLVIFGTLLGFIFVIPFIYGF